jgi:hypothetical protein
LSSSSWRAIGARRSNALNKDFMSPCPLSFLKRPAASLKALAIQRKVVLVQTVPRCRLPALRTTGRSMAKKVQSMDDLFKGRHFEREIIVLCVRWYLRFKLSLRDLVKMMAERGLALAHTTIMRWVQRFVPEFEKRWNRFSRPVG